MNEPTSKADAALRDALIRVREDVELRAVVELQALPGVEPASIEPLETSDFETRNELRTALLAQNQKRLRAEVQPTLDVIAKQGLQILGNKMASRTVVLQGQAKQLSTMLGLEGVKSASLDRGIQGTLGGGLTPSAKR